MSLPFQPVPLCAQVETRFTLGGQHIENTYYFVSTFGWGQTELDELTAAVDGWVGAHLKSSLATTMTYNETYGKGLREPIEFESTNVTSAGACSGGASLAPNNQAFAISRRTGRTGRSARGRVFLAGIPDSLKSDDNHVADVAVAGYEALFVQLDSAALAAGWTEVVVSRHQAGVRLTTAITYPVTQYIATDDVLDSQRRRLPGRGT